MFNRRFYFYPEVHETKFPPTEEGKALTDYMLKTIRASVHPRLNKELQIFTSSNDSNWRIRIEMQELSDDLYFVLDVGAMPIRATLEDFKKLCKDVGTISPDIAYCDNIPTVSEKGKSSISQKVGIIKIYVLWEKDFSSNVSRRIADNIANNFVKAIDNLCHTIIVDYDTLRLL